MKTYQFYTNGRLPIDQLTTLCYALSQINQAVDDMLSGMVGRGVIGFR